MPTDELQDKLGSLRALGEQVCQTLCRELNKLGLEQDKIPDIRFEAACFDLQKDPYSGENSLRGDWFNERKARLGSMLFHADGSFFVEYDVVHPHPTDRRWFIEAVTAWGRDGVIKSEARLLPALGD